METLTIAYDEQYGVPKYAGQRMTKADFLRWESDDNYAYEFNDGLLEPTTGMRQDENYLLANLETVFFQTAAFRSGGRLRAEMDFWVTEKQMRRADVSCFTSKQMQQMQTGQKVIPGFVVEFASHTDNTIVSITKRHEYFEAGVQVVWWVYPIHQEVHVYTSPKTVSICTDDDLLSAAPALPEMQMTVAELFGK
jgi:Uma2 family endonuclease